MSMLRHGVVASALCAIFGGQLFARELQPLQTGSTEVATSKPSKEDQALDAIKKSGMYLQEQFQDIFRKADYNAETLTISIGEYKGILFLGAGVIYNFGFAGAGNPETPLPALKIDAGSTTLGQFNLLREGLNQIGAKQLAHFFDMAKNPNQALVFIIRTMTLLVSAYRNRDTGVFPTLKDVPMELSLLFTRLKKVPNPRTGKPYTLAEVLTSVPPVVTDMLKKLVIKGITLYEYLKLFYKSYKNAATQKFLGDIGYDTQDGQRKLSDAQTVERLFAILLRVFLRDLKWARGYYLLTAEGKKRQDVVKAARAKVVQFGPGKTTRASAKELAKRQQAVIDAQRLLLQGAVRHVYARVKVAKTSDQHVQVMEDLLPYMKSKVEEKSIQGQTMWVLNESIAGFVARELARLSVQSDYYTRNNDKVEQVAYLIGLDLSEVERDIKNIKKEVAPPTLEAEPDAPNLAVLEAGLLEDSDPFGSDEGEAAF